MRINDIEIIKDILKNLRDYEIDLQITDVKCDYIIIDNYKEMSEQLKNVARDYMSQYGNILDEKTINDLNLEIFNNFNSYDKIYYLIYEKYFLYFGTIYHNPYDVDEVYGVIKL